MCIVKIFDNIYVHSNQNKDEHNDVVSRRKKCLNDKKKPRFETMEKLRRSLYISRKEITLSAIGKIFRNCDPQSFSSSFLIFNLLSIFIPAL